MNDLSAKVIIEDAFSAPLNKFQREIAQSEKALSGLGSKLDGGSFSPTEIINGISLIGTTATAVVGGIGLVGRAIAEAIIAGSGLNRVAFGFQNLTREVDIYDESLLRVLQTSSRGTIANQELMLNANRALLLGVTKNADELGRILEVAIARGRALGISETDAFDQIVTGIGRVSPKILDNLGILTGGQQGFAAYAQSIGKTLPELTELEKRQYLVNKVMADTTPIAEDAKERMDRLSVSWTNFTDAISRTADVTLGGSLQTLGLDNLLNTLSKYATTRVDFLQKFKQAGGQTGFLGIPELGKDTELNKFASDYGGLLMQVAQGKITQEQFNDALSVELVLLDQLIQRRQRLAQGIGPLFQPQALSEDIQNIVDQAQNKLTNLAIKVGIESKDPNAAANFLATWQPAFDAVVAGLRSGEMSALQAEIALGKLNAQAEIGTRALGGYAERLANTSSRLRELIDATKNLNSEAVSFAFSRVGALGGGLSPEQVAKQFNVSKQAYKDQEAQLRATGLAGDDLAAAMRYWADQSSKTTRTVRSQTDAYSGLRSEIESLISSSVSGTKGLVDLTTPQGMVGGFDPNGPARDFGRMWDVAVNGFQSQWLDELRAQGLIPQDVIDAGEAKLKEFASAKAKAFQAGTDLSLLDRTSIENQVKQQLEAQKQLAALRDSIVSDLVGQGLGTKQQVTTAVNNVVGGAAEGVSTTQFETTGGAVAASLKTGLDAALKAQNIGSVVYDAWSVSFNSKGNQEAFASIGESLGGTVSGAFVEAMKKGVGNVRNDIASIVAPEVAAILAAKDKGKVALP